MAYDVEDKVVQMRFDNRDFDPNIDASIKSLEKLEKSLGQLKKTDSFDNIDKSAKKFNLDPAVAAVESLKNGFSAMEVVAITAISNITNKAMAMGAKIMDAFAIAPLRSGFSEYSEQMNSTQVILSNLPKETLGSVTESLDELNEYADRTIYSFGQMTQAIGKFAAAGVELKPATAAIKGLSSAAATVGANNQQLYSAYYNLAQSMQLGYMQLIDWKSLETSTIGNRTMKDAFIKTAEAMGTFEQAGISAADAYADFRGTLNKKWLTSDVIIETLNKYSRQIKKFSTELGDSVDGFWEVDAAGEPIRELTEVIDESTGEIRYVLESTGELLEQWEVDLASTAFKSATEIKSFSQMWDTLTEAAGTGWAETWKIIFGDLEKAKKLWTGISKPIERTISLFNDMRNSALKAWETFGGQEDLIQSLINLSEAFGSVAELVGKTLDKFIGYTEVNGEAVSNLTIAFYRLTEKLRVFTGYLILSDDEIERTSDGLANLLQPLKLIGKIIGFIAKVGMSIVVILVAIGRAALQLVASIGLIPEMLSNIFGEETINTLAYVLGVILELIVNIVGGVIDIGKTAGGLIYELLGSLKSLVAVIFGVNEESITFQNVVQKIAAGLAFVIEKINAFVSWLRVAIGALREFLTTGTVNLTGYLKQNGSTTANFFISGVAKGLSKGIEKISSIGSLVGKAVVEGFMGPKGIDAHSPAKTGIQGGAFFLSGVGLALTDGAKEIASKAADVATGMVKSFVGAVTSNSNDGKGKKNNRELEKGLKQAAETGLQIAQVTKQVDKEITKTEEQATVIQKIGTAIKNVFNTVKGVIQNLSLSKVLIIALSTSIVALLFSITKSIMEFSEVLEGLGRMAKATGARIYAEAFDQLGQALFSIAKSLALIMLIGHFDPKGLKQAIVVLGAFLAVLGLMVWGFSKLVTIGDKVKAIGKASEALKTFGSAIAKVMTLTSIALMISSLSLSMMMLAESLKTLSEIENPAKLWAGVGVITVLIAVLTGFVLILGKSRMSLIGGAITLLAFSKAMQLFGNTLTQVQNTVINPLLERFNEMTKGQVALFFGTIAALTVLNIAIQKTAIALSRVIVSLALLAITMGIMSFLMGVFKENVVASQFVAAITSTRFIVTIAASLAGVMIIFAVVSFLLLKNMKKANMSMEQLNDVAKDFSKIIGSFTRSISTITGSFIAMAAVFGLMSKIFGADVASSAMKMATVSLISVSILAGVLLFALTYLAKKIQEEDIDPKIFDRFAAMLMSVSISITIIMSLVAELVVGAALFWHIYDGNTAKGWMVLGSVVMMMAAVCGIIAGLLVVIGRNFKNDSYKSIAFTLIPIIAMIGELLVALALFSTIKDWKTLIPGVIAILSVMIPVIVLISQMHKLLYMPENTATDEEESPVKSLLETLVTVLVTVAVLIGEIAAISWMMSSDLVNIKGLVGTFTAVLLVIGLVVGVIVLLDKTVQNLLRTIENMNPDKLAEARYMLSKVLDNLRDILIVVGSIILAVGLTAFGIGHSGMSAESLTVTMAGIIGLLWVACAFIVNIMKMLMNNTNISNGNASDISMILDNVRDILIAIGSIILAIGLAVFAIGHNGQSALGSMGIIGTITTLILDVLLAIGAFIFMLLKTASQITGSQVGNVNAIINQLETIFALISFMIISIGASLMLIGRNSRSALGSMGIISVLTGTIGFIFGAVYLFMKKYNSLPNINNINVAPLIIIFSCISGLVALIGGLTALLQGINLVSFGVIITGLMGAVAAISGLTMLIMKVASNTNINPATIAMILGTMVAISIAIAVVGATMGSLANIDANNITTAIELLGIACTAILILGGVAAGLAAAFSAAGAWSALVIAFFGAMTTVLLAFGVAVSMIADSKLETITDFLKNLTDESGKLSAVGKALWGLVGAMTALAIGLTLGGPGILIVTGLILSLAAAFASFAASMKELSAISEPISVLADSLTKLQGCIGPLIGVLAILTLFSPVLVALSIALAAPVISMAALVAGIVKLVQVSKFIPEVLRPVVESLADVGNIIANNTQAFVDLGLAIAGFGVALAIAGPGLIALAAAIGIVAIALGAALLLASPFVLALGAALWLLIKAISSAKDAMVELFNVVIDRLPEIAEILQKISPMAEDIRTISDALLIFGIALLAIGAGAVLSAVGIVALGGAFKLLSIIFNSMDTSVEEVFAKLAKILTSLAANPSAIMALGGALIILGVGLAVLSAGALGAAIGLAALGGALALLTYVTGSFETLMAGLSFLLNNKGNIAGLGGVISVLAVGITILGVGCLLGSIGILAFAGALQVLTNVAGSFETLIAAFSFLLNNKGNIAGLGGVLAVLGVGILAFGLLTGLAAPGIITFSGAMMVLSAAILYSATMIGNAMTRLSDAFKISVENIVEAITKLKDFVREGVSAATDFVNGFINTVGNNETIHNIFSVAQKAGAAAVEGFRSKKGIDSHSDSKQMISAAKDFINGFVHTVKNEGFKSSGKYCKEFGAKAVNAVKDGVGEEGQSLIDTLVGIWGGGNPLEKIFSEVSNAVENAIPNVDDLAGSYGDLGSAAGGAKGTIESLTDTLRNQLSIFERFTYDEAIMDPEELINNMKSQLRGMQNWANGIDELAVRGMSGPLLQYLSEMGPEGYRYVEAFLEMTESEFAQANQLYSDSLEMPSSVADQIGESYKRSGVEIVESVGSGISSGGGYAVSAMEDVGEDIEDAVQDTADESKDITIHGVNLTQEDVEKMLLEYGPDAGLTYVESLKTWMDSDQFRKYAAECQGKIGSIFQVNMGDLINMSGLSDRIIDGEKLIDSEHRKYWLQAKQGKQFEYMADGVKKSAYLKQYLADCDKAGHMIGATIINGTREELGIASPSKEYEEVGKFSIMGFIQGLLSNMNKIEETSDEIGNETLDSLSNTIKAISSTFTDDMDTEPTIRPVLDLSNIYDGMNQLDTLFSTNQARVAGTAYMTAKNPDDTIAKQEAAYRRVMQESNIKLIQAIQNSDQPVTVNVTLNGDAASFFDAMVDQTRRTVSTSGNNPLLIMNRKTINAGLA